MVFPVAALLATAASLRVLVWAAVILAIAQQGLMYLLQPMPDGPFFHYYTTPLIFAPFFAVGFVIHRWGGARSISMLPVTLGLLFVVMGFLAMVDAPLFRSQGLYLALMALVSLVVLCAYRSEVSSVLDVT